MKRLTCISATSSALPNRQHHHHHHHSHSFSYSNNATNKERLFPLHRSITEDDKYQNTKVSPITKFVCKLLGLAGPSSSSSTTATTAPRPKSWHKSRSTTSITKSSVTSSYQHTTLHACSSAEIAASAAAAAATTPRKPTAITIVTPKPCTLTASIMEWDHRQEQQPKEDDVLSVSSSESSCTSTSGTMHSSISSISHTTTTKTTSAAVDALVIASLLPSTATAKTRSTDEFDDMPSIHLIGRQFDINTAVLTEAIAEMVRPYIPRRYRIAQKWNLLYSLDQHGVSLATLYSCMKNFEGPCIMIIRDAQNQIFGSYLSHPFSSQSHYYGTGECFLWKLNQQQEEPQPKIKVFPWTGKNDYMMLSDSDFVAIGGGDGKFGLWLNSELEKGYSNTCPTFDNEILALQPEFQCMEMEVWGLCI